MAKIQSVEPNVADLANGWMRSYKLDYKLEQESLNTEIDRALDEYFSNTILLTALKDTSMMMKKTEVATTLQGLNTEQPLKSQKSTLG